MKFLDLYSNNNRPSHYLKFLSDENKISVRSIVEVGTWEGRNAVMLRGLFPEAHLYLIDPWVLTKEYLENGCFVSKDAYKYDQAYELVTTFFQDDPLTTVLRMTSVEGASKVPDEIDLAFIDGDHCYKQVKQDIMTWQKKVRKGGLLTGHDYIKEWPGVIRAVNELLVGQFSVGRGNVWATII